MSRRKRQSRRIEPTLDGPRRTGGNAPSGLLDRRSASSPSRPRRKKASGGSGGRGPRRRRPRRKSLVSRAIGSVFLLARRAVYWSFVLGIWGGIALAGIVAFYAAQMPNAATWSVPERAPNVRIVSIGGEMMANRGATGGEQLALSEMSPFIPQAVMAIEDRRFKDHFGIDPIGLARAMAANVMAGGVVQGGSTVTQQLAKNLFLSPERTIERKVQEVLLALWLEQKFSKDQIMEMYLNRVYFGSNAYGVEAAARRYFDKPASQVTLAEAALLAGLLKAPSRLSPARDPQAAEERAQVVLEAMREEGFVSDAEVTTAMTQSPTKAPSYWTGAEHYVADRVMELLPDQIGAIREDLIVQTTIDAKLQTLAEQAIVDTLDREGAERNVSQGALVSIDATGAIRAMVGGRDYAESQFNRVTEARRQPGSAFKPFVYAAALERGVRPSSMRNDAPIRIGDWTPENYDNEFHGPVTIIEALARSLNTIAAQLVMEVGPSNVTALATRLGISSELNANASIALGTSEVTLQELTAAYAPLMNGGYRAEPHIIEKVTTVDGTVLFDRGRPQAERVLDPYVAGMMNLMLSEVVKSGTGRRAALEGWQAAGKTGTTQSFRDALFVGYTANLTTGVWFGNDDGASMEKVTGGGLPAATWQAFMSGAHAGVPVAALPGLMGSERPLPPLGVSDDVGSIIAGDDPSRWGSDIFDYPAPPRGDVAEGGDMLSPPAEIGEGAWNTGGSKQANRTTFLDFLMGN